MSNYVTAIGLDVHARSIKACALNPMTGEVERASFGYDPASVAEWALSFESCIQSSPNRQNDLSKIDTPLTRIG